MNEALTLAMPFTAGIVLGAIFFGGLWWTIRRGFSSKRPALWFLGSLLLRTSLVLAGFYVFACGDWKRLLACLCGFIVARVVLTWLTRKWEGKQFVPTEEASHAP